MKTFIAVTFLGILMHAYAEECKLRPAAENFDSNKYFDIPLVYVTHTKSGHREDVCQKYQTTNNGNGTSFTVVSADYTNGDQIYPPTFTCTDKPKSGGDNGHFIVECEIQETDGSYQYEMEVSVIATDNQKYAILQVCTTDDPDDILVLQTSPDGVHEGVKQFLDENKWDISKWGSRKSVGC